MNPFFLPAVISLWRDNGQYIKNGALPKTVRIVDQLLVIQTWLPATFFYSRKLLGLTFSTTEAAVAKFIAELDAIPNDTGRNFLNGFK